MSSRIRTNVRRGGNVLKAGRRVEKTREERRETRGIEGMEIGRR